MISNKVWAEDVRKPRSFQEILTDEKTHFPDPTVNALGRVRLCSQISGWPGTKINTDLEHPLGNKNVSSSIHEPCRLPAR